MTANAFYCQPLSTGGTAQAVLVTLVVIIGGGAFLYNKQHVPSPHHQHPMATLPILFQFNYGKQLKKSPLTSLGYLQQAEANLSDVRAVLDQIKIHNYHVEPSLQSIEEDYETCVQYLFNTFHVAQKICRCAKRLVTQRNQVYEISESSKVDLHARKQVFANVQIHASIVKKFKSDVLVSVELVSLVNMYTNISL